MKQKTRSAFKKRIRVTGTGKIRTMKAARRHLLQQKSKKQKRLGKTGHHVALCSAFKYQVIKAMPYLGI